MEVLAAGVAGGLFGYNRENFFFDGEQRLKREYQGQAMRVAQFGLFREDVRDLMELTVAKMDNYLIVNTIQVGLVVVLFTEGRPQPGFVPNWLLFLWALTGASAFMYITLCIWLAMHASISSHSFGVRMLTQLVRLPVPNKEQLDAARVHATDYEGSKLRDILRVPVVKQQLTQLKSMMENVTAEDEASRADRSDNIASQASVTSQDDLPTLEDTMVDSQGRPIPTSSLKHVKLYRQLQANWQAYDAYARVSMAMGTNQLLQCLAYTCLNGFTARNSSAMPGVCAVLIFSTCASLLLRLDLYVQPAVLVLASLLNFLPPLLAGLALCLILAPKHERESWRLVGDCLVPVTMALHTIWITLLLKLAQAKTVNGIALPTNFRSVLYLDVFGWLTSDSTESDQAQQASAAQAAHTSANNEAADGQRSQLDVVLEEEPLTLQEGAAATPSFADDAHRNLRSSLASLCWGMKSDLDRDISYFEGDDVAPLLESNDAQIIVELRRHLTSLSASLREAVPEADGFHRSESSNGNASVWLKLQWNPSGNAMEFFHQVGDKDDHVVWTRPLPPNRVLDMAEIRLQLAVLEEKVQLLISEFQTCAEAASLETGDLRLINVPRLSRRPTARSTGSSSAAAASDLVEPFRMMLPDDSPLQGASPIMDGPAQETRFGGSEAVQLAEVAQSGFGAHPEEAEDGDAGGFHPHRPRAAHARRAGQRHRHRHRTPGHLPWSTVQRGSMVIIFAWCVGFVWSLLRLWTEFADIMKPPDPVPPELERLYAGPWPHEFFEPRGLACRQVTLRAPMLLVAEKHAVHQLHLHSQGWELESSPEEAKCLAQAPLFHTKGLGGVAVACTNASRPSEACSSLLLSSDGKAALRCGGDRANGEFLLFGGPWQPAASTHGEGLWALRPAEAIPTLLEPQPLRTGAHRVEKESPADLVPSMELGAALAVDLSLKHLDMIEGGGLLALSPTGVLHAWLPTTLGASTWQASGWSYALPASLGLRWSGMCIADGAAFLIGNDAGGGSRRPELWRLQLPEQLISSKSGVLSQ